MPILSPHENTNEYLAWLHELTHLGYKEKPYIIVSTKDAKLINDYFTEGKTTQEALELYKKFRNTKP